MQKMVSIRPRWRIAWGLLFAMLIAGASPAAEKVQPVTFVFLGELESIRLLPEEPCPPAPDGKARVMCIHMDDIYEARYRVLRPLHGAYPQPEITFTIADHYGFPEFARYRDALLYVILYEDGPHLTKYQGYPVHRTADGRWAFCGDPSNPDEGEPVLNGVEPLHFAADAGIVADRTEQDLREQFPAQDYEIQGGAIRCKRGMLLEDLDRYVRQKLGAQAALDLERGQSTGSGSLLR